MARAFSLVELLVVISIFFVISTVILANHSRFNSSVLLGNLAYDIALSIRQAQVYGVSTRQYSSQFQIGYGVRFSDQGSYAFFTDVNANQRYDQDQDTIIQTYSLGRGYSLVRYCGVSADGVELCSDGANPIQYLDITFLRPNPDANIVSDSSAVLSTARIVVRSQSGETRTISVASTGQISVGAP